MSALNSIVQYCYLCCYQYCCIYCYIYCFVSYQVLFNIVWYWTILFWILFLVLLYYFNLYCNLYCSSYCYIFLGMVLLSNIVIFCYVWFLFSSFLHGQARPSENHSSSPCRPPTRSAAAIAALFVQASSSWGLQTPSDAVDSIIWLQPHPLQILQPFSGLAGPGPRLAHEPYLTTGVHLYFVFSARVAR